MEAEICYSTFYSHLVNITCNYTFFVCNISFICRYFQPRDGEDMYYMDNYGDDEDDFDDEDDEESMLMSDNMLKSESSFNEKMQYDSDNEVPQNISGDGSEVVQFELALCNDNESSEIIDENYDPSEFLLQGRYGFQQPKEDVAEDNVSNDLVVSDSEDECNKPPPGQVDQENEELWF